ncbi:MAG: BspA family leucine-rich repeat surface protein [Cytophagales bacterium]|nr:BspA family leucine-rich repeat surface protein [Cytophagales bacterium]
MKNILLLAIVSVAFSVTAQNEFITTWQTTSGNESITIPTTGTGYDYTVDWGDGNTESGFTGDADHTYTNAGTYTVAITGDFPRIYFNDWGGSNPSTLKIQSIDQWGDQAWVSMELAFSGCRNLTYSATDVPNLSAVTSLFGTFYNCQVFDGDIGSWDVSSVTNMSRMFRQATTFNGDIRNWDVSSVTDMSGMFWDAKAFNQNLSGWDVSNVTDMTGMFGKATTFNGDIRNWDVSSVTDMSWMFYNADAFNQSINSWDVSSVTNMSWMFDNADAFNQDIGNWNVSNVTNMSYMFNSTDVFNQDIDSWDVSSVTNMISMFNYADVFNQDLSGWNVSNVTQMSYMFNGASTFNNDISSWDVSSVSLMSGMFSGTNAFDQDISNWNVSNVTDMSAMFTNANAFNQNISNWDVSSVMNMSWMFRNTGTFNQDISNWNVSNVTDMSGMFSGTNAFNQDISSWDVSSVTDMASMLDNSNMSAGNYDRLLSAWSKLSLQQDVTLGAAGLSYCGAGVGRQKIIGTFNWVINDDGEYCTVGAFITTWQTTTASESITIPTTGTGYNYTVDWGDGNTESGLAGDAGHTYATAGTNTVTITGDFPRIYFNDDSSSDPNTLKIMSIKQWGDQTWTSMDGAFSGCSNLTYNATDVPDLSGVTSLSHTFSNCLDFNGNIGSWDVRSVTDMASMLDNSNMSAGNYDALLNGWSQLTLQSGVTFGASGVHYCNGSDDKQKIIDDFSWTIGDAGQDCAGLFITTWQTTTANESITIPTTGTGYNYTVDWGDGNTESGFTGDADHTYATAGTYTVAITGDFPRIYFFDFNLSNPNTSKIKSIDQWGDQVWTSMEKAFEGCENMTYNATDVPDLSSVTSLNRTFRNCQPFNGDIGNWNVSSITDMSEMFFAAWTFNQDISSWDVSSVADMSGMFSGAHAFNQDISKWDVSSVTEMFIMFAGADAFNQDISSWDVSNVTDMSSMFFNTDAFNQDISSWDVSSVTDMSWMFSGAFAFNQDIGIWDVGSVTDMSNMFYYAEAFNQDINSWDVSSVMRMSDMFYNAEAFNQDIGSWDVSNVTDMSSMFFNTDAFNQDISSWDVTSVTDMLDMFSNSGLSQENYDDILVGWSQLTLQSGVSFGAVDITYCEGADARQTIIDDYGWTITDGGENCSLAVSDGLSGLVEVYPNPAEERITIKVPAGTYSLQLLDLTGKELQRKIFTGTEYSLEVNELTAGNYLLKLSDDNSSVTRKLIRR